MQLLLGADQFRKKLASAQHRAFHLETRDDYLTESEEPSLAAFREDETIDPGGEWFRGWTDQVETATARGVAMQRARIVSVPHTLYTRYLLALTQHNIAAGEEVRYLPRQLASANDSVAGLLVVRRRCPHLQYVRRPRLLGGRCGHRGSGDRCARGAGP